MRIKYFKNGNINIQLTPYEVEEVQAELLKGYYNEVTAILDRMDDIELADQCEQCAGNYTMCYVFYNAYTGCEYATLYKDFLDACKGKTVKLYGREISDDDLKEYYSEYYGD